MIDLGQHNLELRVRRRGKFVPGGAVLFTIVHNEEYLLPHFFAHYEAMGVTNFVVFDDKSTDRTEDILLARRNVEVLISPFDFAHVVGRQPNGLPLRFGQALRLRVPRLYAPRGWALIADADEFLVLPPPFVRIHDFLRFLEEQGVDHVTAAMVDFYPPKLRERNFSVEAPIFLGSPCFDRGPLYDWTGRIRPKQFPAGVRARLLRMLQRAYPEVVEDVYGDHPVTLAKTWKVPLIRNGRGVFHVGDHEINMPPQMEIRAALAHFKFCPNLDHKIASALMRKSYYNMSMEYRFLKAAIDYLPDQDLITAQTVVYDSPESLVRGGYLGNHRVSAALD